MKRWKLWSRLRRGPRDDKPNIITTDDEDDGSEEDVISSVVVGEGMEDEYGEMKDEGKTYNHPSPFELESGKILANAELRYMTYGTLNSTRDNVLVVCHALTGNASLHSWWGDLLGPGRTFDTERYHIICCNILGSWYGSTAPMSNIPSSKTKEKYGIDFPDVSVQDTVRLQLHLLHDHLNLNSIKCVIGGSFGGMQTVEFAAQAGTTTSPFSTSGEKPFVRSVVPIACGASHSAWQIAVSEAQRQAIYADPKWRGGKPTFEDPAVDGLSVARQIGMITYRTSKAYDAKFGRRVMGGGGDKDTNGGREKALEYGSGTRWNVKSYLEYQGQKFLTRFDPITYVKLTEQMDSHDVGRGRGGKIKALAGVDIPVLVLGIDSDVLYPMYEQEELAGLFPRGELGVVESDAGHDGFLLEQDQIAKYITQFFNAQD